MSLSHTHTHRREDLFFIVVVDAVTALYQLQEDLEELLQTVPSLSFLSVNRPG